MSNWVQKDAAELLSISPRVMNYKIKTLGIEFSARPARRPLVGSDDGCAVACREPRLPASRSQRLRPSRLAGATFW